MRISFSLVSFGLTSQARVTMTTILQPTRMIGLPRLVDDLSIDHKPKRMVKELINSVGFEGWNVTSSQSTSTSTKSGFGRELIRARGRMSRGRSAMGFGGDYSANRPTQEDVEMQEVGTQSVK